MFHLKNYSDVVNNQAWVYRKYIHILSLKLFCLKIFLDLSTSLLICQKIQTEGNEAKGLNTLTLSGVIGSKRGLIIGLKR